MKKNFHFILLIALTTFFMGCQMPEEEKIDITSLDINESEIVLKQGETFQLEAIIQPANATYKSIEWYTEDNSIASINASGEVLAKFEGRTWVGYEVHNSGARRTCEVKVLDSDYSIDILESSVTIAENQLYDLSIELTAAHQYWNSEFTVVSSDESVVKVTHENYGYRNDYVILDGISEGSATITVTSELSDYFDTCEVDVVPVDNSDYFITEWFDSSILIPIVSNGNYHCTVIWPDGNRSLLTSYYSATWDVDTLSYNPERQFWVSEDDWETLRYASFLKYTAETAPSYEVKIIGKMEGWHYGAYYDNDNLIGIKQWGILELGDSHSQFWSCDDLVITATDSPKLTNTESFLDIFRYCSELENVPGMNNWDTSSIKIMDNAFYSCGKFDQNLSSWNTSSVTSMKGMFQWAHSFNQDLNGWDTSNVTDMSYMFNVGDSSYPWIVTDQRGLFNGNISLWKTGNVTDMSHMFECAHDFNQNISGWDTSKVTNMSSMFYKAGSFDQNLSGWDISNVTNMSSMFSSSGLSTANYDAILIGWAAQDVQDNVSLGASGVEYSAAAESARNHLINEHGWTINDGGLAP